MIEHPVYDTDDCTRCHQNPAFIITPRHLAGEGEEWSRSCLVEIQPRLAGNIDTQLEGFELLDNVIDAIGEEFFGVEPEEVEDDRT